MVLFTRGPGCSHIAELVSDGSATRVEGDLKTACIATGANVLVTARASSFDLASTLVPHGISEDHRPPVVVGAVGTGPHSPLVAATTHRLAKGHGADALLVTMASNQQDDGDAQELLDVLADNAPGSSTTVIRAAHPAALLESLPPEGLVVLGAPGGSWWQRQFFGPGRRLIHAAPSGSIVVRAVERRCFHSLMEVSAIGPLMRAADALAVTNSAVVPVVDDGRVVGQVRRTTLVAASPDTPIGQLSEAAITARADEPIDAVAELAEQMDGAPVTIVDDNDRLLGGVPL